MTLNKKICLQIKRNIKGQKRKQVPEITGLNRVATETMETAEVEQ